jgi:hypothetical protein
MSAYILCIYIYIHTYIHTYIYIYIDPRTAAGVLDYLPFAESEVLEP